MTGQVNDAQATAQTGQASAMSVHLTAKLDGNGKVVIESDAPGKSTLPKGSGPHRFTFHLTDETNLNVEFLDRTRVLDVDESENCPPRSGINTDQVDPQSVISSARNAAFTDQNSGAPRTLSYALNFKCDDTAQKPQYDPIIINGGQ